MNCQQNCNKLKNNLKIGLNKDFFLKIRIGRVSGNKQLFSTPYYCCQDSER